MADSDIAIVGLQAIGGVSQIVLSWAVDDPNVSGLPYLRFDHAEVQYSLSADMSSPVSLGTAFTAFVDLPVSRGETRYYQVRAINQSDQEGEWSATASANEISGDVSVTAPDSGYWKLPNGLIFQWGIQSPDIGSDSISFLLPFPNAILTVVASYRPSDAGIDEDNLFAASVYFLTSDSFKCALRKQDGAVTSRAAADYVTFFAIGY